MIVASGQSWIQKQDRDNFGNRDFIRVKYLDEEENVYCWGYYKNEEEMNDDFGSHIYGSKAVIEDQLKNFVPFWKGPQQ
jgi:uncharacterized protein (DUF927 family)